MNRSSSPRQQLLLVDDEEDALLELAELLEGEGFVASLRPQSNLPWIT